MAEFDEFFADTKDRFFSYLIKLTGNREDAADILQESYLRMFQHYKDKLMKALLYRIGYNLFIDSKRKTKNNVSLDEMKVEAISKENPSNLDLVKEKYDIAIKLLERLNEDERNIIAMISSGELTYKEIGEILKISEANVKVKVHRIRKKIKNMMLKEGVI